MDLNKNIDGPLKFIQIRQVLAYYGCLSFDFWVRWLLIIFVTMLKMWFLLETWNDTKLSDY